MSTSSSDLLLSDVPIFAPNVENWTCVNCDYFDFHDLSAFIRDVSYVLLMVNIRSCKKKFNQFLAYYFSILKYFSCIILMEIWLTADIDNIFVLPGFHCHNLYRGGLGGGIKVYVRDSIQSKIIENLTFINDLFEMLTVELLFFS